METFTVVVYLWLVPGPGEPWSWDWGYRKAHAGPERRRMQCCSAAGAAAAGASYCFLEGRPAGVERATRHQTARPVRRVRRDPGQEAGLMKPFTPIVVDHGPASRGAQILNMGRGECIDRLLTIQGDRDLAKGQCIGAGGYILPTDRPIRSAVLPAVCCWMMPERKRVICGFAACWQGGKRIS